MIGAVSKTINGRQYQFPKLTVEQVIDFTNQAFESKRGKVMQDLDDAQATPQQRMTALESLRQIEGSNVLLLEYIQTFQGQKDVIVASINRLSGAKPKYEDTRWSRIETFELAASLCGFEETPQEGDNADDDGRVDGNPTYANAETGLSTPALSPTNSPALATP